jgi:broad specificity phosphatase PhoE
VKSTGRVPTPPSPEALAQAFDRIFDPMTTGATELVLVRHAEPDFRAAQDTADPWDPPLTERGRAQAMRLALRLRTGTLDAVYASTMRRAFETAAIVAAAHDLPVTHVHDLREITFDPRKLVSAFADGEHRNASTDTAMRFLISSDWNALPGFEPSERFRQRVLDAMRGIARRHAGQRVAIVCHGGVINAYLGLLLGMQRDMFFLPEHASLSVVRVRDDLSTVRSLNDHAHLAPATSRQRGRA